MANLADLVKAALAKKQAEQRAPGSDVTVDSSKSTGKQQVTSNKPTKKSAGRGR